MNAITPGILTLIILSTPALGGESQTDFSIVRNRHGVSFGPQMLTGRLMFSSAEANTSVAIKLLPSSHLSVDFWPTESMGFSGGSSIGFGTTLSGLLGQEVTYNIHEFNINGRYRWFLGPRAQATALGLSFGMHGLLQRVQEQRPPVILDRTIVGPELGLFAVFPIWEDSIWARVLLRAGLPFYIRESPADSGDPETYLSYGARTEFAFRLASEWYLQFTVDFRQQTLQFSGEGTRALGVTKVETDDYFLSYGVAARYAIPGLASR